VALKRADAIQVACVCGLLLAMLLLMLFSALGDSVTTDELTLIPNGVANITTGELRFDVESAPLLPALSGIAVVPSGARFPYDRWRSESADPYGSLVACDDDVGEEFLFASRNDPDLVVLLARLPIMLLMLLFGCLVYAWARTLYGASAGLLALALFAFNTNILAHGHLATTDAGLALGVFANLFCLYRFLMRPTWWRLIVVGVTLGLAIAAKFTALLLLPTYALVMATSLVYPFFPSTGTAWLDGVNSSRRSARAARTFACLAIVVAIGLVTVWLVYLPQTVNLQPSMQQKFVAATYNGSFRPQLEAMTHSPILRPAVQMFIAAWTKFWHERGGATSVLLGQVSSTGWWYYYPLALWWKTQLALFVLVATALIGWNKLDRRSLTSEFYLLMVPVGLLVAGMSSKLDLGIRYMLPIYPFLFVFVSKLASKFNPAETLEFLTKRASARQGSTATAAITVIVAISMVWYVANSLIAFPNYVAYFNEVVGGCQNGERYLSDSNLDWGQDAKRLAAWTQENAVSRIYVDILAGPASPKHYLGKRMVEWSPEKGQPRGYFAVSSTTYWLSIASAANTGGASYAWLDEYRPIANVGGSIRVYDLRADLSPRRRAPMRGATSDGPE